MLVSDPLVVEELADMHLCFLDGRLQVSDKFAGCASVFDRVMFCILSVMNFTKFSEGRWLSIGKSCRAAVGARLLGLDDLVSRVMEDPCESTYYIHGWQGLDNSCREYMIIESLSSHLGESLHYALIDDNRVLKQLDMLKQLAAAVQSFRLKLGAFLSWEGLPRTGPENIQIAFNVRFRRGLEMTSTSLLEPFTDVLAYLATPTRPATTANPGSSGEPRQPSWKQLVLERFPWMQGALEGGNRRGRPGDRAGGQPNDRNIDESANDPEPLDDELIEEAFAMLEAKRAELASTDDIEITDFTTGLLGGTWTMAHSGKAFDAYQSKIRGGSDAIEWCNQYNCTKSARFDISLYGDAQASLMAREWARRLQYFFNIYTSSGDAHYVFSDDDVKSYVPTVGFLELERDFNARALVRWRWLACFVPKK
jgi:hypothetical protein